MKKNKSGKIKNVIIGILVLVLAFLIWKHSSAPAPVAAPAPAKPAAPAVEESSISITSRTITEDNFTGSEPVFTGSGDIVAAARSWIDQDVADFQTQANTDVPAMKAKFGPNAELPGYTLDIKATYEKGPKTESIIMTRDAYTGGANDNLSYKIFTASLATGKILSLSDVVKSGDQSAFLSYVKKKLTDWRPQGASTIVVFPDSVNALTFSSFTDWSMNANDMIIYFDQDAVGPGSLGAVPFLLPVGEMKTYLNADFQ